MGYFSDIRDGARWVLAGLRIAVTELWHGGKLPARPPGVGEPAPPRVGRLVLEAERCTACELCAELCPVACIDLAVPANAGGEPAPPIRFAVDFGRCILCGLCAEHCPPGCLQTSPRALAPVTRRADLVVDLVHEDGDGDPGSRPPVDR